MLQFTTEITLSDYRSAVRYGMLLRTRRAWLLAVAVVLGALGWFAAGAFGLVPASALPLYVAAAYLVWMLLRLAQTERDVLRYAKAEGNLLGVPIAYAFTDTVVTVEIESRGEKQRFDPADIVCVYEQSRVFMMYVSADQVFLIPRSQLTERQSGDLRTYFARHLKDRFFSRHFARSTAGLRLK